MFDWLFAQEIRLWFFVAVCVIAVLLTALGSLLQLTTEIAVPAAVGLVAAAQWGFFIGLMVFTLLFLALYIYMGRPAKVKEPA